MTVRELAEWAEKNNALDMKIGLQYQDSGGTYRGNTYEDGLEVTASIEDSYILLE